MITDFSNTRTENIVANELDVAASSFSTFQTPQNVDVEMHAPDLCANENGKVTESKLEEPSSSLEAKGAYAPSSAMSEATNLRLSCDAMVQNPASSVKICEEESETTQRAIITTHISAQKMHDPDVDKFEPLGGNHEGDETGKFGGIHVMIEQVVVIELNIPGQD